MIEAVPAHRREEFLCLAAEMQRLVDVMKAIRARQTDPDVRAAMSDGIEVHEANLRTVYPSLAAH